MYFFKKLKKLRISRGFTQHFLAKQLNINDCSYQNYEYGKRKPDIKTLILLSAILNVSLDELLCREDYLNSLEEPVDES